MKTFIISEKVVWLFILIVCLIVGAVLIFRDGGAGKDAPVVTMDVTTESPETVPLELNEVQERLSELLETGDQNADDQTTADVILKETSYKVLSVKENSCVVEVKSVDLKAIFNDIFSEEIWNGNASVEEFNDAVSNLESRLNEAVQMPAHAMATHTVEVPLDENGSPQMTEELADALYGGLYSLYEEVVEQYYKEYFDSLTAAE